MSEGAAVLAEDDGGAPSNEDVLLAVCDGDTVVASDAQAPVVADCVGADLMGKALDKAVQKDLFCWLQVRGTMGQS